MPHLALFLLLAQAIFIYDLTNGTPFYYDAGAYWELARGFEDAEGDFALTNYKEELRGYIMPLFLYGIQKAATVNEYDVGRLYYAVTAVGFSALLTLVLPAFFRTVLRIPTTLVGTAMFAGLVWYFWRGYFLYPLTDFFSLALIVVAAIALAHNRDRINPALFGIAGAFAAAAVVARPAYQVSIAAMLIWLVVLAVRHRSERMRLVLGVVAFVAAASAVFAPQIAINKRHYDSSSPLVVGQNLYSTQLGYGLVVQKYETFVGADPDFPPGGLAYRNRPGIELLREASLAARYEKLTYGQYARIAVSAPLTIAGIYARHVFNALDPIEPTPYLFAVEEPHPIFSTLNYLVWFGGLLTLGVALAVRGRRRPPLEPLLGVGLVALPVLLAVPVAVEIRFFLPLFLLCYGALAYLAPVVWPLRPRWLRGPLAAVAIPSVAVAFVAVCFAVSGETLETAIPYDRLVAELE